eukprot:12868982-Alexandrium_andersonii.AAC.1
MRVSLQQAGSRDAVGSLPVAAAACSSVPERPLPRWRPRGSRARARDCRWQCPSALRGRVGGLEAALVL